MPYRVMIEVRSCTGPIEIGDLELDGQSGTLIYGGRYGDTGRQIPGIGLSLIDNKGPERLSRLRLVNHPLDGLLIDGLDAERTETSILVEIVARGNLRQGCSIVGGRNYQFDRCQFSHNGRGPEPSAPRAGVDIEAEANKKVRNVAFRDCRFVANGGVGLLANDGDSANISAARCEFVGSANWAAWPNKPHMTFDDCRFVGPIVNAYGNKADPRAATRFTRCQFLDDPRLSPDRRVYRGQNPSAPIADLPFSNNVTFDRCSFRLTAGHVLPWNTNVVRYVNCTMSQVSQAASYPRGTFVGRNTISGHVDLYSARNLGELIVNGFRMAKS